MHCIKTFLYTLLLTLVLGSISVNANQCNTQAIDEVKDTSDPATVVLGSYDVDSNGLVDDIIYRWNPAAFKKQSLTIKFKYSGRLKKSVSYRIPTELLDGFATSMIHLSAEGESDIIGINFQIMKFDRRTNAIYRTLDISNAAEIAAGLNFGDSTWASQVHVDTTRKFEKGPAGVLWDRVKQWFSEWTTTPRWYTPRYETPHPGSTLRYVQLTTPWIKGTPGFEWNPPDYDAMGPDGPMGIGRLAFCGTMGYNPNRCSSSETVNHGGKNWTRYHYWFSVECGYTTISVYFHRYDEDFNVIGKDMLAQQNYWVSCNPGITFPPPRG